MFFELSSAISPVTFVVWKFWMGTITMMFAGAGFNN